MPLRHREFAATTGATAAFTSSDLVNDGYTGVLVFVNVNSVSVDNVTVTVQGKSPVGTDEYYTILASAALTSAGLTVLTIHPSVADATNLAEGAPLPPTWRVVATVGGGGAYDYDIGYAYIP